MFLRRPSRVALVILTVALSLAACNRVEEPVSERRPASSSPGAPLAASPAPATAQLPALAQLLTLPTSAYQASLFADDEAIELLTNSAAYRLLPGKEPLQRALDLGFAATVTRGSYVYWSAGAIWSASRRVPSSATKKLADLDEQPQRFVADLAGDAFAWLAHSADDRYAIDTLASRSVKRLYTSPGSIDALTMIGDVVYFVERPDGTGWRIARVKLSGGDATFTARKTGRWPAMLRGNRDHLVFYDGNQRDVLTLSPDLQQERTLAKDFICSPLALAADVYCSTMEGIFELPIVGKPQRVAAASRNLITNLAASAERLAFISDVGGQGQDQLAVNVVLLSKPNPAEAPH
ncbi:MAG: hypothetical protein WDO69_10155 [Pseudomonadota bacterium]